MKHRDFWAALERRKPEAAMALGLERVERALEAAGRPDLRFPSIVVAGTNGKGSTGRFVADALAQAGRRVGLFVSPHVFSPTERIEIGGTPVHEDRLVAVLGGAARAWPELTWFELFYIAAVHLFAEVGVDVAVFEVGLGGRLDATNATGRVICTAITSIGLDHTHLLGETIEAITTEKAGILRQGVPLVTGPLPLAARKVIAERVRALAVPWRQVDQLEEPADTPQWLRRNLAVARSIVHCVAPDPGFEPTVLVRRRPPGRWQVLSFQPLRVLDGAHNPDGVHAALQAWRDSAAGPGCLYVALPRTKDLRGVGRQLADWRGSIVAVERGNGWWSARDLMRAVGRDATVLSLEAARTAFLCDEQPSLWIGSLRGLEIFGSVVARCEQDLALAPGC